MKVAIQILLFLLIQITQLIGATVDLQDTVLNLDGRPTDVVIEITPSVSFTAFDGDEVFKETRRARVVGGVLNFPIIPNAGSTPTNTSYTAVYKRSPSGPIINTEIWVVPNTDPVNINTIRVTSIPTPGLTITLSQITASGATTGQLPRFNGTSWVGATLVAGDIPNLATSKITSGTFADARIAASNVTQHEAALSVDWSQLGSVPMAFSPIAHASGHSAGGADPLTTENQATACANDEVLKASSGLWVCGTDDTGGGAAALDDLSDVTITTPVQHNVLVNNGAGAFVNTNLLTAIAAAGLTDGRVPFTLAGALTSDAGFLYSPTTELLSFIDGVPRRLDVGMGILGGGAGIRATGPGTTLYIANDATVNADTYFRNLSAWSGKIDKSQRWAIGSNFITPLGTLHVMNNIASTGDTLFIVQAGAGEAGNLTEWQNNAGGVLAAVRADGGFQYGASLPTKPTCAVGVRGTTWYTPGGVGVKDAYEVCGKDAGDAYAWRVLY